MGVLLFIAKLVLLLCSKCFPSYPKTLHSARQAKCTMLWKECLLMQAEPSLRFLSSPGRFNTRAERNELSGRAQTNLDRAERMRASCLVCSTAKQYKSLPHTFGAFEVLCASKIALVLNDAAILDHSRVLDDPLRLNGALEAVRPGQALVPLSLVACLQFR